MATRTLPAHSRAALVDLPVLPKQTAHRTYTNDADRRAFMQFLAQRDNDVCAYCRRGFHRNLSRKQRRSIPVAIRRIPTLDHLIPHQILPEGGPENYVLACRPCNTAKGNGIPAPLALLLAVLVVQQLALRNKGVRL